MWTPISLSENMIYLSEDLYANKWLLSEFGEVINNAVKNLEIWLLSENMIDLSEDLYANNWLLSEFGEVVK